MSEFKPVLHGLVPEGLKPRTRRILLEDLDLPMDIGFHEFEIGRPQRVLVTVEVWLDERSFVTDDQVDIAWNYDCLRTAIVNLAQARRFNLQETLAREIYEIVAARQGVTGLRVSTRKPDVYADCRAVGVELSSF